MVARCMPVIDVRDNELVAHFIAAAEAACGAIDILVNAAGTTAEHPACGYPDDLWNKIIDPISPARSA